MVSHINEEETAKWKDWKGYDLETVQGDIADAPFVPKRETYEPFWALWGCKWRQRPWKRQKIFSRYDYLIIMTSVIPGVWMDIFFQSVIELGAAHIFQVFICVVLISITLIYAECFIGDYTKRSACYFWNAMPITYCFMVIQLLSVAAECQQGSLRTMIYFQRFIHHLFFEKTWNDCPEENFPEYQCFDDEVNTLSKRCESGGIWVVCPDDTTYILPTHYYYLQQCRENEFYSTELVIYVIIHWIIVAFIASRGLVAFIQTIKWSHIFVVTVYVLILFYLLVSCGKHAIKSVSIMSALNVAPFGSYQAWMTAFEVAVSMCNWGMMTYCSISSGLVFRTSRWLDSLIMVTVAVVVVTFCAAVRYGFLGCLASRLETRIETIWKPRGVMYTDTIIPYYFRNEILGPLFTALLHFTSFTLHIWTYAAITDAIVYGIAELSGMLEWQSTLLMVFIIMSMPLSIIILVFTECDIMEDTGLRAAFMSLKLVNMTAFAITLFWLYGYRTLAEDHFFMYGYRPLGFISLSWPWIPLVFLIVIVGDIYSNIISDEEKRDACIVIYILCFLITIFGILIIVWRQRLKKKPLSELLKPLFTWGPPNGPLRRARKRFKPRAAYTKGQHSDMRTPRKSDIREYKVATYIERIGFEVDIEASRWKQALNQKEESSKENSKKGATQQKIQKERSGESSKNYYLIAGRPHLEKRMGEFSRDAARAMVYAEDVSFFELARAQLGGKREEEELPGTLPKTQSAEPAEPESPLPEGAVYMEVEPVDVKGLGTKTAEGLDEENLAATEGEGVPAPEDTTLIDPTQLRRHESAPHMSTTQLLEQTISAPEIMGPVEDPRRRAQIAQTTALRREEPQ